MLVQSRLHRPCSFADGESLAGMLSLGESDSWLVGLSNSVLSLYALEFNVAVAGEVGRDSTMSTVGSSASGDSALDTNVVDDALVGIKVVELSVGLKIDKELSYNLDGLLWPSSLCNLEFLALSMSSGVASVLSEGNNLFVFEHVFHVLNCLLEFQSFNCAGSLICVLVMSTEVCDLGLSSYRIVVRH